jgi:Fe-S-cluster containining protein
MTQPSELPTESALAKKLDRSDNLRFRCHPGVSCWNVCCRNADVTLTPYDIMRLQRRLGMSSEEFLKAHAVPFTLDHQGLPGLKLRTQDEEPVCLFSTDEGCSVYEDRPAACRFYPLGHMSKHDAGSKGHEEAYFLLREEHCKGHDEDYCQTIGQYCEEQGVDPYEEHSRHWREIVMKKRSSGPSVGAPTPRSMKLFFMASYNFDMFRAFVASEGFQEMYELDEAENKRIQEDDEYLLDFAGRFLKQVLFGEESIPVREEAREARQRKIIEKRKEEERQRIEEATRYAEPDPD